MRDRTSIAAKAMQGIFELCCDWLRSTALQARCPNLVQLYQIHIEMAPGLSS